MGIEKERGISVVTSVMTFEYATASSTCSTRRATRTSRRHLPDADRVDSAVMVIDAAKGNEARTRKLFEVCRLRDIPIVTFVNKLDRNPATPSTFSTRSRRRWPSTSPPSPGRSGAAELCRHLRPPARRVRRLDARGRCRHRAGVGPRRPALRYPAAGAGDAATWREEAELAEGGCKPFDLDAFREGHLTPVFFGSALRNFGVRDLIDGLAEVRAAAAGPGCRYPRGVADRPKIRFVFQDPGEHGPEPPGPHRLHAGLLRQAQPRMKAKLVRTGKPISLSAPQFFFAQDRAIADEAYAATWSASPTTAPCASATP